MSGPEETAAAIAVYQGGPQMMLLLAGNDGWDLYWRRAGAEPPAPGTPLAEVVPHHLLELAREAMATHRPVWTTWHGGTLTFVPIEGTNRLATHWRRDDRRPADRRRDAYRDEVYAINHAARLLASEGIAFPRRPKVWCQRIRRSRAENDALGSLRRLRAAGDWPPA